MRSTFKHRVISYLPPGDPLWAGFFSSSPSFHFSRSAAVALSFVRPDHLLISFHGKRGPAAQQLQGALGMTKLIKQPHLPTELPKMKG